MKKKCIVAFVVTMTVLTSVFLSGSGGYKKPVQSMSDCDEITPSAVQMEIRGWEFSPEKERERALESIKSANENGDWICGRELMYLYDIISDGEDKSK